MSYKNFVFQIILQQSVRGLIQEILETIWYYYVDLKPFLQKVGLDLQKILITHEKETHHGPTTNVAIDFHRIDFEIALSPMI